MQITRQGDREGGGRERERDEETRKKQKKGLGSPGASLVFPKVPPERGHPSFFETGEEEAETEAEDEGTWKRCG